MDIDNRKIHNKMRNIAGVLVILIGEEQICKIV